MDMIINVFTLVTGMNTTQLALKVNKDVLRTVYFITVCYNFYSMIQLG